MLVLSGNAHEVCPQVSSKRVYIPQKKLWTSFHFIYYNWLHWTIYQSLQTANKFFIKMNEKKQESKIRAVCVIWFQSKIPENCKATCMFSSGRKVINNCTTSNLGTKEIQRQTQQSLLVTSPAACPSFFKWVWDYMCSVTQVCWEWISRKSCELYWVTIRVSSLPFFPPQNQISFRVGDEQTLRVTPSSWATVSRQSNIMRYHVSAAIKPHEWF